METSTPYLNLEVVDISRLIYSGPCKHVVAPAAMGEVCILPRHIPFLTRLNPGIIRIKTDEGENALFLSGGFMEVGDNQVTILADEILRGEEIDREAALEAKQEAEKVLRGSHLYRERDEAKLRLVKALAQLQLLETMQRARGKTHR